MAMAALKDSWFCLLLPTHNTFPVMLTKLKLPPTFCVFKLTTSVQFPLRLVTSSSSSAIKHQIANDGNSWSLNKSGSKDLSLLSQRMMSFSPANAIYPQLSSVSTAKQEFCLTHCEL
jgi:hypothetical protein